MFPLKRCPRCARQNLGHARFCAECGLDIAGVIDPSARRLQKPQRSGNWPLVLLVLFGLLTAAAAVRSYSAQDRCAPRVFETRRVIAPQCPWQQRIDGSRERLYSSPQYFRPAPALPRPPRTGCPFYRQARPEPTWVVHVDASPDPQAVAAR